MRRSGIAAGVLFAPGEFGPPVVGEAEGTGDGEVESHALGVTQSRDALVGQLGQRVVRVCEMGAGFPTHIYMGYRLLFVARWIKIGIQLEYETVVDQHTAVTTALHVVVIILQSYDVIADFIVLTAAPGIGKVQDGFTFVAFEA